MPKPFPSRRSLVVGALAAVVTGCGSSESASPGGGREPSETSSEGTPSPEPSAPGEPMLNWLKTGGFAGVHVRTLLYEDGRYTVSEDGGPSRTGHLPAGDLARVRALLEEARLGRQPRRSIDPNLRDAFRYRVAYDGHVVLRDDATLSEPLRSVAELLPAP